MKLAELWHPSEHPLLESFMLALSCIMMGFVIAGCAVTATLIGGFLTMFVDHVVSLGAAAEIIVIACGVLGAVCGLVVGFGMACELCLGDPELRRSTSLGSLILTSIGALAGAALVIFDVIRIDSSDDSGFIAGAAIGAITIIIFLAIVGIAAKLVLDRR